MRQFPLRLGWPRFDSAPDPASLVVLIAASAFLLLPCSGMSTAAEPMKERTGVRATPTTVQQTKLLARRMMLLERKRAVRDQLQKSMPLQEEKIRDQNAEYEMKKEMYDKNLISKSEVDNSERALTRTRMETERVREWIAEDDRALSLAEEAAEEELREVPRRVPDGYPSTAALIRYDGVVGWSLTTGFDKIDNFYRERFGRPLPISAMGQSHTHDRLGLDHRDAVDVAVRPDGAEGRGLMAYLRAAGIPFIAFRGKMSSMSTGAHIHIGRPSRRLVEVKHRLKRAVGKDDGAEHG